LSARSTIILVLLAALPVYAAFRPRAEFRPPPAPSAPVSWTAAALDGDSTTFVRTAFRDVLILPDGSALTAGTVGRNWRSVDSGRTWGPMTEPGANMLALAAHVDVLLTSVANGRIFPARW
jgi:hypothetical protein